MNISTVPRKRRPRAAGEVSISSQSLVYLTNDKNKENSENKELDHLYENAIPKIIKNENKPIRIEYQSGFCLCRLVQPENSGDTRIENQLVTVFIGKCYWSGLLIGLSFFFLVLKKINFNYLVFSDDSDHHYESLYSMEEKRLELKKNNENNSQNSAINHNNDTEYDSFDTDHESDEDVKKDDSGVDISNTRLPDPPPSQKYAIMQKIKNFGSLSEISKSLSRITRKKSTTTPPKSFEYVTKQIPEPAYDSGQYYENTLLSDKTKIKKSKFKKISLSSLSPKSTDPYENTEFHSPRTPTIISQNSTIYSSPTSSQNLNQNVEGLLNNVNDSNHSNLSRKKSKTSKSFKSKLKKTLVPENGVATNGNSLMGPRSTFYVSDSVDLDSGIFSG